MTAPSWLAVLVAALMMLIAASCAVRLGISMLRGRASETDADGLHVLMGVAMAGMLEPRLSPVPDAVWQAVFAAAAAWFGWQAIRSRRSRPGGWRCAHPAPHAVECAAMLYMLRPDASAVHAPTMPMSGMTGAAATGSNPAIALVLAMFMLCYVLWSTDRIAALSRPGTAAASIPAVAAAPLAPRFAAGYKIAMSIAMGYMLITML